MTEEELRELLHERMEWDGSDLAPITIGSLIAILKACGVLKE